MSEMLSRDGHVMCRVTGALPIQELNEILNTTAGDVILRNTATHPSLMPRDRRAFLFAEPLRPQIDSPLNATF